MSTQWIHMAGKQIVKLRNHTFIRPIQIVSNCSSAMYYISNIPKKIDQFLEMGTYIGMQNGNSRIEERKMKLFRCEKKIECIQIMYLLRRNTNAKRIVHRSCST